MKKFFAALLIFIMVFSMTSCTESSNQKQKPAENTASSQKVQVNGMLWGVEPLKEKTKLTIAYVGSSSPPLTTYIAQKKGWLEAANIEVEMVLFANGPAMMEACSAGAWDCGSTGIGGAITGVLGHDIKILATASRDEGGHQAFFARKDSPIVAAGKGKVNGYPEVYGTADTWKGKNILCAKGTTNHFTLYKTLKTLGLTLKDVNVINMDISSANTAFKAGQGDIVGVWGPLLYAEDKKDLVMVSSDAWVKTGIVTNYVAAPKSWDTKQEAIKKWLEITIMGGEWAEANMKEAAQMMVDMNDEDGYPTKYEDNFKILDNNPFATLEDNYKYYTEKNSDGTMLKSEAQVYDAMAGFVEMGNYTKEQLDSYLKKGSFLTDPIISIYKNVKGK